MYSVLQIYEDFPLLNNIASYTVNINLFKNLMQQIVPRTIQTPLKSRKSSSNPPSSTRLVQLIRSLYTEQNAEAPKSAPRNKAEIISFDEKRGSIRNLSKQTPKVEKLDIFENSTYQGRAQTSYRVDSRKVIPEYEKESQKSQLLSSSPLKNSAIVPVCLTGVVDDAVKIKKLEQRIEQMKVELNEMNINMRLFYNIGLVDDKVFKLCQAKELKLVADLDTKATTQIYADSIIQMVSEISKKVIKYHTTKQQLKYLRQKPRDNIECHLDHVIPEKISRHKKFPVSFEKQLGRRDCFAIKKESEKNHYLLTETTRRVPKRKFVRKNFHDDNLRWTHNFESYTKRGLESSYYQRTLNSTFADSFRS